MEVLRIYYSDRRGQNNYYKWKLGETKAHLSYKEPPKA